METGLYEQLINKLIANKLDALEKEAFHVNKVLLDKQEAAKYLGSYLMRVIRYALNEVEQDDRPMRQIEISNKIIRLLNQELRHIDLSEDILESEGQILNAVFSKKNFPYSNFLDRIKEITPYTRLTHSELFTGNSSGLSLDSEIKKEIQSSDEICWLVSFIKFSGIRIFKKELEEFANAGKSIRIITTSYMGATDLKAVEYLASLPNAHIKISYNSEHERLHAKAYLFRRKTGFHTGYIGSSNISRSALTSGLEWNMKITTAEVEHIIEKFQKTFETYWEDKDFEDYHSSIDAPKLKSSLQKQRYRASTDVQFFFDIKPFTFQEEILSKLQSEREVHSRFRNLIVAATGTGKTVISAFDFKRFQNKFPNAKLLFVAHRKEILLQARATFQQILHDLNFGELWVDGEKPEHYFQLFASVQTLNNQISSLRLDANFFDFIIIDEVHHIAANSYRQVLNLFQPKILLGLTATPERMDGEDILNDFSNTIAAEIRLPEALNRKLLCPFQYFAISDSVDLTNVAWTSGRYEISELTKIYTGNDRRVGEILKNMERYLTDVHDVRALGFCASQEHARYMAEKFTLVGLKAAYLTSANSSERDSVKRRLIRKEINYLFAVDIFNEGVDIPEIDTVLFLRPTESLTLFLQQLGRGLRIADNKDCLTVLDFVGNSRPEYDFEQKFRALVGKTNSSTLKEIEDEFPHLPLGCSIVLERKAKEVILNNIKNAIDLRRNKIINKIVNFKHNTAKVLTLSNFLEFHHLHIKQIYKRSGWMRLCADAGVIPNFIEPNETQLTTFIGKKLLSCNATGYLKFIRKIFSEPIDQIAFTQEEQIMKTMLHYDIWQTAGSKLGFTSIDAGFISLKNNPIMVQEVLEVVEILISKVDVIEKSLDLGFVFPLKLHCRYSRDQILAALRLHTFDKASSNREGVAFQKELNAEAFFVTLKKSEENYSPTTLYDDYAISETLFHWQSQNSASEDSNKGKSYIEHKNLDKKILLFVREQKEDEYGFTMSFVFLGDVNYVKHEGGKPMNIEWKLSEPMPSFVWKESGKLAVG